MSEEKRIPKTISGYTHMTHEAFRKELDEWIEQIKEGEECSEQEMCEMVYYEMVDWLDDNVVLDKDEVNGDEFEINVHLNEDGVVTIQDNECCKKTENLRAWQERWDEVGEEECDPHLVFECHCVVCGGYVEIHEMKCTKTGKCPDCAD